MPKLSSEPYSTGDPYWDKTRSGDSQPEGEGTQGTDRARGIPDELAGDLTFDDDPESSPTASAAGGAGANRVSSVLSVRSWGELRELAPLLPKAPRMTEDLLPVAFRPWITDIAERLQVPLENIAAPAMIAVAGVVGRACGIYPKQHDNWLVIPNLWGGLITRTGFLKTACLTEAFKPVHVLIDQAREEYGEQDAIAEAEKGPF